MVKPIMSVTYKTLIFYLFLVMVVSLATNLAVDYVQARNRVSETKLTDLTEIVDIIEQRYVDDVPESDLMENAITGMLTKLDPYSEFLLADRYDDLMVHTKGEFGGIGIRIALRDEVLTVMAPMEGTPAKRVGLRSGDQIIAVESQSTLGWDVNQAIEVLRGPKGTVVNITVNRPGHPETLDFSITRDIIKIESVPYAFVLDDNIGYVRVVEFTEKTGPDLARALTSLRQQGAKRLVLDLRDNPGGLLESAIEVAEQFLTKEELIVFTKGRTTDQNHEYKSRRAVKPNDRLLMAVLVNEGSASASEIVAGAIQDHDIGVIIGKPTFGKGSVQSIFQLSPERALKLTTAKYYTPSGRCIHKDHNPALDPFHVERDNEKVEKTAEKREEFRTDTGRIVYGGGGIAPDVEVAYADYPDLVLDAIRKGLLFTFAINYTAKHPNATLDIHQEIINAFREEMITAKIEFTETQFNEVLPQLTRELRREFAAVQKSDEEAYRVGLESDPQLKKALAYLREAKDTTALLKLATMEKKALPAEN